MAEFGNKPLNLVCSNCDEEIATEIEYRPSMITHVIAAIVGIYGSWILAPMVYKFKNLQVAEHYCPNCGNLLGEYDSLRFYYL